MQNEREPQTLEKATKSQNNDSESSTPTTKLVLQGASFVKVT